MAARVRCFVSHAFDEAAYRSGIAAFRRRVTELAKGACADLGSHGIEVAPDLRFEEQGYGSPLLPAIRAAIRECDVLIADISQATPEAPVNSNVMYELGFAMALGRRVILMRRRTAAPPPTDIGDLLAGSYDDPDEIPTVFLPAATEAVRAALAMHDRDTGRLIPKVWFPADVRTISIVCAREKEPTRFSHRTEPDYVHIDNFEDRDALLELSTFFARQYPKAKVVPYLEDDMPHAAKDGDIVVLGGPGCNPGEGNGLTRSLMSMVPSSVRYPASGEGLVWRERDLLATAYKDDDDTKGVRSDWGVILAAPNPYNPEARVVMLHGTTTCGTLGAALALTDASPAITNHLRLAAGMSENRLTGTFDFEALVRVEVDADRRVRPPALQTDRIRRIASA